MPMTPVNDPTLAVYADVLDDLEAARIANANRLRILTRNEPDDDGINRGHGLTQDHPDIARLNAILEGITTAENQAVNNLEAAMRRNPLGPFVKNTPGLGLKQTARLLSILGDPYWHSRDDRPRTVSELWAYCGLHTVGGKAPARTRGQTSNWNEDARKRVWVIASAVPKFKTSPYEPVYRLQREKYEDAVHDYACPRCGPSGSPAPAGSPLSPGHQQGRAVRYVGKTILKDLWRASRDHHESEASIAA